MEITVRSYQPGDEGHIVELLDLTFQGWPPFDLPCSLSDHWKWKYPDNKAGMLVTVAEVDGRIAGCVHGCNRRVKIGDGSFILALGADVAVHPDSRSYGIYSRMDKVHAQRRLDEGRNFFVYTATQNPTVIKTGGPIFPHPLLHMIRVKDIGRHIAIDPVPNQGVVKAGFSALKFWRKAAGIFRTSAAPNDHIKILEVERFDGRMDIFWEAVQRGYSFIFDRTSEYLNWRYCDKRAGGFKVVAAEENGEILGFMALRINRRNPDYPEGYLADLLALPGREDAEEKLMMEAERFFEEQAVNIVHACAVKGHHLVQRLNRYGFINSRRDLGVYCKFYREGLDYSDFWSSPAEKTHFQFGDTDCI